MNRRGFFGSLVALAVIPVADKLAPFLPESAQQVLSRNGLLTTTEITREALRVLHHNTNFLAAAHRSYDPHFASADKQTIRIRVPSRYQIK